VAPPAREVEEGVRASAGVGAAVAGVVSAIAGAGELGLHWRGGGRAVSNPGPQDCAHRIDVRKISDTHKKGRNRTLTRTPL